ncbi:hypothetical protein LX90_009052 [Lentzea flava]|nr:hypothetical protein [Lentzea flava]
MLAPDVQTGLRVGELTSLTTPMPSTRDEAHVTCTGKGRHQRAAPLTPNDVDFLSPYCSSLDGKHVTMHTLRQTAA